MNTHLPVYIEDLKDSSKPYQLHQEGCGCCSYDDYMDLDEAIKYTRDTLKEVTDHLTYLEFLSANRELDLIHKMNEASKAIYEIHKNGSPSYVIQTPYLPEDLK
tara:strand:- start:3029 stop:3340 length:312 start_codon:yes stop_codon:yes gene_type:complete